MFLKVGQSAPKFSLSDQFVTKRTLADFAGEWLLIYFYPKDDTSGCTKEACAIRDNFPKFKKSALQIVGVSVDSVVSHAKFANKYKLPFTLLADEKKEMVKSYGVWQKKKFMGREYMGTVRASYSINPQGKIAKVYAKVKPEEHAGEVLKDFKSLK